MALCPKAWQDSRVQRIAFEAERDEWRGYFDRMVEGGCTSLATRPSPIRAPCCCRP
jgi:hypothetical protein